MSGHDGLLVQLGNAKKLYLSNEILYQEAVGPLPILEAVLARGLEPPRWRRRVEKDDLEVYETATGTGQSEYAIAVRVEIEAHLMEVFHALVSDTTEEFEAVMRGLFGRRFRRGAVLHRFDDENAQTRGVVKTAVFSNPNTIGKDHEYCFVDYRVRVPEKRSVMRVMKSLPKEFHDRLAGKNSVLGGAKEVVCCTHAEQVTGTKTRLTLYASCAVDDEALDVKKSYSAMERPMQFLVTLGRGLTQRLFSIIERRRLGYQSFIHLCNKVAARGVKSCKVCGKAFGLLRIEFYCQLCGYRTCAGCSESMEVETRPGVLRNYRVCQGCVAGVHKCVFDDDDLDLLGSKVVSDFSLAGGPTFAELQAASLPTQRVLVHKNSRSAAQAEADAENQKLVEYLFSPDPSKQAIALERFAVTVESRGPSLVLLERVLRHYLAQQTRLAVTDCVYAEEDGAREYLLNFEDGLRIAAAPPAMQEHVRADLILRLGLLQSESFDRTPFERICEIAAKVMDCRIAYISVVSGDMQYSIAHHNMPLTKLPRRETMCAYALTSDRPFVVRYALHDLRFREFFCVARNNFNFYASFPIDAPSTVGGGGIVAGLVVVDRDAKKVITNRQYTRMVVLAKVVTDLLGALPRP